MVHQTKHFHHMSKGGLRLVMLLIGRCLLPGATIPAFADSPTINGTIITGSLGGNTEVSYNITGTPGSTITFTMPFTSNDLRGTEEGWHLSISSTTFTGSAGTMPAEASTIVGTTATCTIPRTCSNPTLTNIITGVVALPSARERHRHQSDFRNPCFYGSRYIHNHTNHFRRHSWGNSDWDIYQYYSSDNLIWSVITFP